ncbi:putative reverse transcriptase domain-containing protein [Tanacetum coccineum]
MKKTDGIEKLAQLYLKEIVCRHGVPMSVISNRDSLFTSRFWVSLQKALGTQLDLEYRLIHPENGAWAKLRGLSKHWKICLSGQDAPFEDLYGRECQVASLWSEVGEKQLTGPGNYALGMMLMMWSFHWRSSARQQIAFLSRNRRRRIVDSRGESVKLMRIRSFKVRWNSRRGRRKEFTHGEREEMVDCC